MHDYILDKSPEIVALTETWLKENDEYYIKELTPPGFTNLQIDRTDRRGGGVALICKDAFKPKLDKSTKYSSFESLSVLLKVNNKTQRICIIYRPPSTIFDCFSNEFTDFLEKCFSKQTPFIILGDFNFQCRRC